MGFTGYGTAQVYEVCAQPALACFIIRTARYSKTDFLKKGVGDIDIVRERSGGGRSGRGVEEKAQGLGGVGCVEVGEDGVELPEWQVLLGEGTADVC